MLHAGDTFEGLVVEELLGRGGSALVYRARESAGAQGDVALKVLPDENRRTYEIERLRREFELANRVRHPHVIAVGRRGHGWLTMQLVDGGTVTGLSTMSARLTALEQIADALDHAHRCGIVHCDVKPSNILVFKDFSERGAVLIDFGVAHSVSEDVHHRPQQLQASLPYSAPELLRGQTPSAATDEYALACATVELVTGEPPFVAATSMDLVYTQLYSEPEKLSRRASWIPPAFDSVVKKGMAKDREVRYASCTQFVASIAKVLRHFRDEPETRV